MRSVVTLRLFRRASALITAAVTTLVFAAGLTPAGATGSWTLATLDAPLQFAPSNAQVSPLACASTSQCFAAESHGWTGEGEMSLLSWDGTTWTPVSLPNVSSLPVTSVYALQCPSSSSCTGIAGFGSSSFPDGLAVLNWDGTSWTDAALSVPLLSGGARTVGLSCLDPTNCVAVTSDAPSSGGELGYTLLTLTETAGAWSASTQNMTSSFSSLEVSSLWCSTLTTCVAVGSGAGSTPTATEAALYSLAGSTWTAALQTVGTSTSSLRDVWCASLTACNAVGSVTTSGVIHSLGATLSGSTWTFSAIDDPVSSSSSHLDSLSCSGLSSCLLSGTAISSSGATHLMMGSFDGTWALSVPIVTAISPSTVFANADLSCPSATECLIAGGATPSASGVPIASSAIEFAFVDSFGSFHPSALPAMSTIPQSQLAGVSCTSTVRCVAVGEGIHFSRIPIPVIEIWNGAIWTPTALTLPASTGGILTSISCASATSCVAVGMSLKWTVSTPTTFTSREGPMIATLSGSKWTVTLLKNPITQSSQLTDVSCPKVGTCVAVGSGLTLGGSYRFVLAAGKWTGVKFVSPSGVTNPLHPSISCVSTTYCVVVASPQFGSRSAVWIGHATSWASTRTAAISGSPQLKSVSCWANGQCDAVGELGAKAELARLSAGTWKFSSTAGPIGSLLAMDDVKCFSATKCTAVGSATSTLMVPGDVSATFVISGATVSFSLPSPVPIPSGATGVQSLSSVSCVLSVCVGVGGASQIDEASISSSVPLVAHS